MNITKKQQEWIEAYLRGELRGEALQDFEAALAGDELFKKELRFQQSLKKAARLEVVRETIEQARINNLLKNKKAHPKFEIVQNSIEAARTKNVKRRRRQKVKRWLISGAVAACILFTGFWGLADHLKKEVEGDILAVFNETDFIDGIKKDYNLKASSSSGLRSMQLKPARKPVIDAADREIIHKLDEIEAAHREKRFDETLELVENLRKQLPFGRPPIALSYYKANLYAETANYTKSIDILEQLTREKTEIQDDAYWLIGLLYLKTNEKAKAKEKFKILAGRSGKYKDKARQKLRKHFFNLTDPY